MGLAGCGGRALTDSAPAVPPAADAKSEPSPVPADVTPRFAIEVAQEISLTGPPIAAEAILLRKDSVELHTRTGRVGCSMAGECGASGGGYPAMGAAGAYDSEGPYVYGLVIDKALIWITWEISGAELENVQSATGLGLARNRDPCEGCTYVTDGPATSVKEYAGWHFLRERALPDTDPQDVAVATSGKVYVVDAKHRRLLRLDAGLAQVEAIADLPPNAGGNVPTGLAFDDAGRLYVCFRDANTLLVLTLPGGA